MHHAWITVVQRALSNSAPRKARKHIQLQEDEMMKRYLVLVVAILFVAGPAVAQQSEPFNGNFATASAGLAIIPIVP